MNEGALSMKAAERTQAVITDVYDKRGFAYARSDRPERGYFVHERHLREGASLVINPASVEFRHIENPIFLRPGMMVDFLVDPEPGERNDRAYDVVLVTE